MVRARGGDLESLAVLFERHHRPLFNFFVRMTGDRSASEDLVQEVFLRILKYRQTYAEGSSFATWMYQIARNTQVDQVRKRHGETFLDEEDAARIPATAEKPADQQVAHDEEVNLLRRALDRLPRDKRELLVLCRFQELKHEQVAAILACEVHTVKVRLFRAMKDLSAAFHQLAEERPL
jgi:RNA polymerase sigma factor (sigma-70 family)